MRACRQRRPADIDLEAGCSRHQNKLFARRGLDGIGDGWFLHGGILAGFPPPLGQPRKIRTYTIQPRGWLMCRSYLSGPRSVSFVV